MSGDVLWAGVALGALIALGVFEALLARAILPMANALKALNGVDAFIDDRIAKTIGRIRERESGRKPPATTSASPPQRNAAQEELARTFGGLDGLLEPIGDQPDAGMEIES
jgi:hypothetical protein